MYPASLVAYYFVKRGIDERMPLTQMKLQKLVYFAQGVHLIIHKNPLISEQFQAWKYGPVIPAIYNTYKFYGSEPIDDTEWAISMDEGSDLSILDNDARETLEYTWDNLKDTNAIKLSNWTHNPDSPWAKSYVPGINDVTIPNEKISAYFERFLVK
ncbi:MAG: type II toxin-antitoxin system antitoxin SocA domain-containing protein [Ferruginibacter sp.]